MSKKLATRDNGLRRPQNPPTREGWISFFSILTSRPDFRQRKASPASLPNCFVKERPRSLAVRFLLFLSTVRIVLVLIDDGCSRLAYTDRLRASLAGLDICREDCNVKRCPSKTKSATLK
jgi:hypothetical protein